MWRPRGRRQSEEALEEERPPAGDPLASADLLSPVPGPVSSFEKRICWGVSRESLQERHDPGGRGGLRGGLDRALTPQTRHLWVVNSGGGDRPPVLDGPQGDPGVPIHEQYNQLSVKC